MALLPQGEKAIVTSCACDRRWAAAASKSGSANLLGLVFTPARSIFGRSPRDRSVGTPAAERFSVLPLTAKWEHMMQSTLDGLASSARHLFEFRARAARMQADTDTLIERTEIALADSRMLIRRIADEAATPRVADEPFPAKQATKEA